MIIVTSACVLSCFHHVRHFLTLWTVAHQAPLSMGFSRQEYWSGLPCSPPGDLPNPGIEPTFPVAPALQADSLLLSSQESPSVVNSMPCKKKKKIGRMTSRQLKESKVKWGGLESFTPWSPREPARGGTEGRKQPSGARGEKLGPCLPPRGREKQPNRPGLLYPRLLAAVVGERGEKRRSDPVHAHTAVG